MPAEVLVLIFMRRNIDVPTSAFTSSPLRLTNSLPLASHKVKQQIIAVNELNSIALKLPRTLKMGESLSRITQTLDAVSLLPNEEPFPSFGQ